jgi:NADPH-dependent ferric siderophore reductase
MNRHEIARRRFEVRQRTLVVATTEYVAHGILRISFTSEDLRDFESPSADDHIKIVIPSSDEAAGPIMRDFTPRGFDLEQGTFTLDFALHERGPAIDWARHANLGDVLKIRGPKGSAVVPDDFDWYLLIGDETALPSISRRLEGLREGVFVDTFVTVATSEQQPDFTTKTHCTSRWVQRADRPDDDLTALQQKLEEYVFPPGEGYIWIATETTIARGLYRYLTEERKHPKEWIKAAGYWTRGGTDGGERIA